MTAPRVDGAFDDALHAARAGAEWAWTRLYGDLAPRIAGYLRAHGAADPDDLTGEVFLQMVRALPGFSGDERAFRAWAFTIAHRRLIDDRRRRGRRVAVATSPDLIERLAGAGGDVHDDAAAAIAETAVRGAIEDLPPDQRAVLLLRIIGDLTVEEIARALNKRPGAVKALQRRGLRRLEGAYPFAGPQR